MVGNRPRRNTGERKMKWPLYDLAAYYNYSVPKKDRKNIRVRERIILRNGSGEKILSERIVMRSCRIHRGKAVLV